MGEGGQNREAHTPNTAPTVLILPRSLAPAQPYAAAATVHSISPSLHILPRTGRANAGEVCRAGQQVGVGS
jgi:hypothetical protein